MENDIWELYGVKENPFSTSQLLVQGGTIPLESFVGRKAEIVRLKKIIGSKGSSRSLIYGDIGVGKTSFVNVVRNFFYQKGYFTHFKEIAVQERWSPPDFILNTLASIYGTLKLFKNQKTISENTFKKLASLFEIGRATANIGVQIGGFGGSYSSEENPPATLPIFSLHSLFEEIISEISKNTNQEIIIHYNNLELLPERKTRSIFNNLRDFFQTARVNFIFIGNLSVHSILQGVPRFSSNLNDTPFNIQNLSFKEIKEILKRRFDALRINNNLIPLCPYTEDSLKELYDLFNGNIRNILNSLSTAVVEATEERPILLDRNKLSKTLKKVLEKRYLNNLTNKSREVLLEIVKYNEITNKGLSNKLKMKRSNVSTYIKNLESEGCVYLRRKNGKDKFWSADPKIKWYLLKGKEKGQKSLSEYQQQF